MKRRNGGASPIEVMGTGRHKTARSHWRVIQGPVRVPGGLLALVLVLMAGIGAGAFWAGLAVGRRGASTDGVVAGAPAGPTGTGPNAWTARVEVGPGVPKAAGLPAGPRLVIYESGSADDPRVPGLNYWVVARYPREEAVRLVDYLWRQGVDAAAVTCDDARLFHVVDLRGFDRQELLTQADEDRRKLLVSLGRQWTLKEKGPKNAMSDAWMQLYTRPTLKERNRS